MCDKLSQFTSTLATTRSIIVLAWANLIAQIAICVTGATVRVTASGLGCSSWPECHPGTMIPQAGVEKLLHQAIEFGNRLLTFVLVIIAVLALISVIAGKRRQKIQVLTWCIIGGILLQAVVGGISVRMQLRWWSVAPHMLISLLLVWIAAVLVIRVQERDDIPSKISIPPVARNLALLSGVLVAFVTITGTLVTAAGPHAGDEKVAANDRLNIDIEKLVTIHSIATILLVVAVLALFFLARSHQATSTIYTRAKVTLMIIVAQGAVGITQYAQAVPRPLVIIHVFLAAAIVAHVAMIWAGYRTRPLIKDKTTDEIRNEKVSVP